MQYLVLNSVLIACLLSIYIVGEELPKLMALVLTTAFLCLLSSLCIGRNILDLILSVFREVPGRIFHTINSTFVGGVAYPCTTSPSLDRKHYALS